MNTDRVRQAALDAADRYLGATNGLAVPKEPAKPRAKRPRQPAAYVPFPVQLLPGPLREYVHWGATAIGCDTAYLALPAMTAVAAAIGNTRKIRLKRGWQEPCVLWTVVIGDSGTLKTPAFRRAMACTMELQRRLFRDHKMHPSDRDAPERIVCSDVTIEKLAELLEENPRGLLLARDELAGWIGSFTRYKKTGGTDLPHWLEIYQAGPITVDRRTGARPHLYVARASVSITGSIQPGVLARAIDADMLESGMAARLCMAMPPRRPKKWTDAEIQESVEQEYADLLDSLRLLSFVPGPNGDPRPYSLHLSADARDAWVAFYDAWGLEQAGAEGDLAAALSKLEGFAARYALIHHTATRVAQGLDDRVPVESASIQAGATLCRWFAAEARRIYGTFSESSEERDLRRLLDFVRSFEAPAGRPVGSITVRELQRSNCRKYPDHDAAQAALDQLAEAELGKWEEATSADALGRPRANRFFVLCMTHDAHDTDQAGTTNGQ